MARCRLRCLLVLLLSTHEITANNQGQFLRIPLETNDQLRFAGVVHLGSSRRSVRVIFDTGSSDTWVSSEFFSDADEAQAQKTFTIGYGGGVVSGLAAPTDLQLGTDLLHDVAVGFVDDTASVLAEFDSQGLVGLGMEALSQISSNSSLLSLVAKQQRFLVFFLYISSWLGAQPISQLILGDDDSALISSNTTWFSFPVVSNSDLHRPQSPLQSTSTKDSFGYWALRVQRLSFDNVALPLGNPNNVNGAALLDSGTSALLLPQHIFSNVVQTLFACFDIRLVPLSSEKRTLPACRPCHVHEFPTLAFDFVVEDNTNTNSDVTTQRLELRGSDYVRCDQRRRECTAMIDSIHSPEISEHLDVIVLGTVFFRAYYTRFDYSNKQVSLACTLDDNGVCLGGLQPALDYRGQPYEPYYNEIPQPRRSWVGVCVAVTALALLASLRILLQHFEMSTSSSSPRTKQHE